MTEQPLQYLANVYNQRTLDNLYCYFLTVRNNTQKTNELSKQMSSLLPFHTHYHYSTIVASGKTCSITF